jgi:hypothetical protein
MKKNQLLIQLSESGMTKVGKEDFAQQPLPQKVFSAIWEVESEVNNGGFRSISPTTARNLRHSLCEPSKQLVPLEPRIFAIVR